MPVEPPSNAELKHCVSTFRDQCIWIQTCFDTNRALFGSGEPRRVVMRRTAGGFFSELNTILIENYIVQVCKITDPARSGRHADRRENLTVELLNDMLRDRGPLAPDLQRATAGLHRYRKLVVDARNRSIAHFDKETALAFLELGRHGAPEAETFLADLHAYVDGAARTSGLDPLDFRSTAGPGDVEDLFRALNNGLWVPPQPDESETIS